MPKFILGLVGGLVLGLLTLVLWQRPPSDPLSGDVVPGFRMDTAEALRDQITALADRLAKLEARQAEPLEPAAERTDVRTVADQASQPTDLAARVASVESAIHSLENRLALIAFAGEAEEPRDLLELAWQLRTPRKAGEVPSGLDTILAQARIPVRTRFLEEWPLHEKAGDQLRELVNDYREIHRHREALEAIDRFGANTRLSWQDLDQMRLGVARREGDRIEISRRLAHNAGDPGVRMWAMLQLAQSLGRTGERDEAFSSMEAIQREFVNTETWRSYGREFERVRRQLLERQ